MEWTDPGLVMTTARTVDALMRTVPDLFIEAVGEAARVHAMTHSIEWEAPDHRGVNEEIEHLADLYTDRVMDRMKARYPADSAELEFAAQVFCHLAACNYTVLPLEG